MTDEAPKPDEGADPLKDPKTTAPVKMPGVMSAREWAERNGIWSSGKPNTVRRRYPYSKM
jgi:hypothetical protein